MARIVIFLIHHKDIVFSKLKQKPYWPFFFDFFFQSQKMEQRPDKTITEQLKGLGEEKKYEENKERNKNENKVEENSFTINSIFFYYPLIIIPKSHSHPLFHLIIWSNLLLPFLFSFNTSGTILKFFEQPMKKQINSKIKIKNEKEKEFDRWWKWRKQK
jgi:hypothetical protein